MSTTPDSPSPAGPDPVPNPAAEKTEKPKKIKAKGRWRRRLIWTLSILVVLGIALRSLLPLMLPVVLQKVAGIYGLTRTMAIELQKHRITVNALAPIAKTRMTEDLPTFQNVETMTPEHIAPAALFLASELCGDKTGHVLAVAGARMYAFKVVESAGKFKDDPGSMWTPQEIAEHWSSIMKV